MDLILLIIVFVLFGITIASYSFKKLDFLAISLVCCFLGATIVGLAKGIPLGTFIAYVDFRVIIIIVSINILTKIAQDSNILEYLAVKIFKISKGNQRVFFYLICLFSTLLAAVVVNDFLVILILAPVVIRLCHYLKINAGTYLIGMTICVNLGGLISPISGGDMIILSSYFSLTPEYFALHYWIFAFFLIVLTILLMDRFILSKEPKIEASQRSYVLEIVNTDVMIHNKKMFYFNSVAILLIIILFITLPLLYLTAAFSALILALINKRYTKTPVSQMLKDVEWELIFFFISLYVLVACLIEAGFKEIFVEISFREFAPFVVYLIIFIICCLLAAFITNVPMSLLFIPIIDVLVSTNKFSSILLLFVVIFGFNIGDNLVPQGSTCNMTTLKTAREAGVKNLSYKRMLKVGATIALIHIALSIGYLYILTLLYE